MKKFVLIILQLICCSIITFSQTLTVGQTFSSDSTFVIETINEYHQTVPTSDWNDYSNPNFIPFDINKDGNPDLQILVNSCVTNRAYYETIYCMDIIPINNCQLVHLNQGSIIDTINWCSYKDKGGILNFEWILTTFTGYSQYQRYGLCSTNETQYFAFRISNPSESNTIMGWLEVHSNLTSVNIIRYAYLLRKKPIITCTEGTGPFNNNFSLNINFPQSVSGFDSLGIKIKNGTVVKFDSISPIVYRTEIHPISNGEVTANVLANVAFDQYDSYNVASSIFSTLYETNRPVVNIYKTEFSNNTIINCAFDVSISFEEHFKYINSSGIAQEAVLGFNSSMLHIINGSVTKFDSIGKGYYRATITPSHEGTLTINVADNVVKDLAGNWNIGAQFQISIDLTPPKVSISRADSSMVNNGAFYIFLTFSEPIQSSPYLKVDNGYFNFDSYVSNIKVKYLITATGENVNVKLLPHSVRDEAGNWNTDTTILQVYTDLTDPTLIISNENKTNVNGSFDVIFTFSEPIKVFKFENIKVSNGVVSGLDSISPAVYKTKITPVNEGEVMVYFDRFSDLSGNQNTTAGRLIVVADFTRPSLTISKINTTSVIGVFDVSFNFSESVNGFVPSTISIVNGTLADLDSISPATYRASIVSTNNADSIVINVAESMVKDISGNNNTASNSLVINIRQVGIKKTEEKLLKIYPNPSNGEIII